MGSVRNPAAGAWVSQGRLLPGDPEPLTRDVLVGLPGPQARFTSGSLLGVTVWYLSDWFYVVLTFVVFAFLYLILKGIETFER
jgi:hypothetical protein